AAFASLMSGDWKSAMDIARAEVGRTAEAETTLTTETEDATKAIEDLVKGFGDLGTTGNFLEDHASDIERISAAIDPVGQALKDYQLDLKIAAAAGLDMGAAQKALARDLIDSVGGFDAVAGKLDMLPP